MLDYNEDSWRTYNYRYVHNYSLFQNKVILLSNCRYLCKRILVEREKKYNDENWMENVIIKEIEYNFWAWDKKKKSNFCNTLKIFLIFLF